jgi:hypothetical protein
MAKIGRIRARKRARIGHIRVILGEHGGKG